MSSVPARALWVVSLLSWAFVALAGPSAAVPGLGPGPLPFDLGGSPSSALVSAVLAVSVLTGGAALWCALDAVRAGWVPSRRLVTGAVLGAALLVVLLPPVGSADHLSYAAYGRVAVLGGDPWTASPATFAGGVDPVVSAVRDPWRDTPSVYGPVGGLVMALASLVGGDSVRTTVWAGQLLLAAGWVALALGLDAALRASPTLRARVAVAWSLNPLLLTVGLGGAHADVLAGTAALATLLLARRHPLLAGLALGMAVGTKLPYGAVGGGLLVAWLLTRRELGTGWLVRGVLGALVVLVPAHVWAGVHAYDQARTASRYVSLATVWRPLVEAGLPRGLLLPGLALIMIGLLALWWRPLTGDRTLDGHRWEALAAGTAAALALGYLLGASYVLPWYDLLLWGPLTLAVAIPALDRLLTLRLTVLALAYVPGLVDGMSPTVQAVTLGFRREVAPWAAWLWLVLALGLGLPRRRGQPLPTRARP
ncbi:hypothetical protein ACFFKU_02125 [Kineococcus gynurae]|uniref:DUF2029 domain-containing protein n=1 Tax=Kineococcus gynurae TaxID=452979 RepID=A0ABV5LSS8_9ACTN